jgi:hypothetical protein
VPERVLNCFPDKSALHEFTARLKYYSEISKFNVFFNNNGPLYKNLICSFTSNLNTGNSISSIENYAGKYNKTYNIIIAPLCLGNYGFKIADQLFIVISPVNYRDGQYRFSPPFYNEMLLWHEICHSFINDLTGNYKTLIEDLKIPDCFKNGVYDDISTVINESLINAICIRLFEINGNIGGSTYLLNESNNKGNIYINDIIQWLIAYEKNTDLSFSDYYIKNFPLLFNRLKLHNE